MSTTSTSAQVPKLRFPGFNGEWKAAELGDYTQTITSGSRDWAQYYAETGSKFVRMTNLPRGGIQLLMDDMRYVALPEDSSEGTRTSLQAEDILISITAELGKIGWIPPNFGEAYINQHTALVRLDHTKTDSRFVAHSLSSERMNRRINRLNDAGAKAGLNLPTIRELDTVFPTLPEQQKIAAFLTAVDGRIEQLSRKKALLEEYKKGVMQQLFTQTLRFQDDHGLDFPDWEEKTLGDVITSLDAGVSVNSEDSPASPTEQGVLKTSCVTKGSFDPNENKRVTDLGERSRLKEPVAANTIIISRMNTPALVGMSGFVRDSYPNLFLPDRLWAAKVSPDHSAEWTAHLFGSSMMRSVISSKATGTSGSMKNITKDDVLSIPVQLPSLPEQTKIAGFLSALDGKIGAVGEQMRQTQAWKKGLLQQLFV
jgi:type I restriction enzyme S subunit